MLLKQCAFTALMATAVAQAQSEDIYSILVVLATALPSSLIDEAITNSAVLQSEIVTAFAGGATPTWFTDLPSDVQSYLTDSAGVTGVVGVGNNDTIVHSNSTSNGSVSNILSRPPTTITIPPSDMASGSSDSGNDGSSATGGESVGSSSAESDNAAPTALIGAGLAGAAGLIGLLAL